MKLYATLRDKAGGLKDVEVPWEAGEPVLRVIRRLVDQAPGLDGQILDEGGGVRPFVSVFLDGRDIRYLGGLDAPLQRGQEIAIFPAVAGGQVPREEATFNGVPGWLLADYLSDLGGDAREGAVRGDGWTATLVIPPRPAGSLGLGRVVVEIEGEMAAEVMAALRAKAMRGGG